MAKVRSASFAGSWYEGEAAELRDQITKHLEAADTVVDNNASPSGLIGPHAGYRYCAPTLAYAFKHITNADSIKRIFVLGPSHHFYASSCLVTSVSSWESPLGTVPIDLSVNKTLLDKGPFEVMGLDVDSEEHSMEMHLPFITHCMGNRKFSLVPIMVGHVEEEIDAFAQKLVPYVKDPSNFFCISSDFCHWGGRFGYTWMDKAVYGPNPYKSIQALDKQAMDAIETMDPEVYGAYQAKTSNTICGRNCIQLWMRALQLSGQNFQIKFQHYSQSSQAMSLRDSSVSYAPGVCFRAAKEQKGKGKDDEKKGDDKKEDEKKKQ